MSNCTSIPPNQLSPPPPATNVGLSISQPAKAFTRGPNDDLATDTLCRWAASSGAICECLLLDFPKHRGGKRTLSQRFRNLERSIKRYTHRRVQLCTRHFQSVPGPDHFLLSLRHSDLRCQQV